MAEKPELIADFDLYKQGAEARLFKGKFLGKRCLAKERFSKKYRHPVLDKTLSRDRLKGEVRALNKCKLIGIKTPTVYLADLESNLIIMEFMEGYTTVREHIDRTSSSDLADLAREMGRILAGLHSNNVIHGDLTTSNILINEARQLVLIDFGLGFSEGSAEDKAVDLYVLERALLSTHPGSEVIFEGIIGAYEDQMKKKVSNTKEIMAKFADVRMRGRKRTMVG